MRRVRFGLIGYGAWGSHHARAIARTPGAELCAVAARTPATCAQAQADHPGVRTYVDFAELLRAEDLDVVDIVVPSFLHHSVAAEALRAGRHVLIEKPLALTVAECSALVGLAQQQKKTIAVGHELRLSRLWGKVKQMVDAGAVGAPLYLLVELWRRPYRLGADGWRYDLHRVGNWILEEPIHFFDLARWYLGRAGEPISVYARANSKQAGHPELQDNFSAVVNFPDRVYAVIAQTLAAFEHHQTVKLAGTHGSLWASWSGVMDRTLQPTFALKHHDGEAIRDVDVGGNAGEVFELADEIAMMVRCVNEGMAPAASGDDGLWSVLLCQAAQRSVDTGGVVDVAALRGESGT
jgi:myo-inositol 2-dehydrogenase/D-chiro-inositol 1-dehydrogenase